MFNETCLYLPSTLSDVLITISLRLTGNLVDARTFERSGILDFVVSNWFLIL
jgi:hypothetical protein